MFHIKTDIRQYKCESTDKVEKLIRNWVIRPSDLIYNADEKTWNPIGQHPAFDDIFSVIEQEESNEPDTIVTEAPSEIAAEHEVEPGSEELPESDEVTHVAEAPSESREETTVEAPPKAEEEGLAADSEEVTNVTEAPSKRDEEASDDEVTDVREDPRETDEQDESDRPSAPDGVTGVLRDSDEITMMTDKTFEMMRKEAKVEEAGNEESTEVVEREEAAEDDSSEGKGRHGLPEEVFITDEIPRTSVEQAVIDELGAYEDEDETEEEVTELLDRDEVERAEEAEDAGQTELGDETSEERKARWRIVMSDDLDEEEADDEDEEERRFTETDQIEAEELEETVAEDAREVAESEEELDEMLDEAAELVGLSDSEDAVDLDDVAIEPIEDAPRDRTETPVRSAQDVDFVSAGYKMPLPVDISPSSEDLELGLEHSRFSKPKKDETFPYPKPKRPGQVETRRFDLDPEEPRDLSLVIVAVAVVGLVVLLGAVTLMG